MAPLVPTDVKTARLPEVFSAPTGLRFIRLAGDVRVLAAIAVLGAAPGVASLGAEAGGSDRPVAATFADGLILVAKIEGQADLHEGRSTTALRTDRKVPLPATLRTHAASSVVLVFSSGAMVEVGAESELVIEQFVQTPFGRTFRMDQLTGEPSVSRTRLRLRSGQMTGSLKPLNLAGGSSYRVVAGERDFVADQGTKAFRIAYQADGSVKSWGLGLASASSRERQP